MRPQPSPTSPAPHSAEGSRPSLLGANRERLGRILAPWLDRPYRCDQIYGALYRRGVTEWSGMTELSKPLREALAARFSLARPAIADRHRSADGTEKLLFRLADGASVEAVDIPDGKRRTLCVSSQAGCALACRFCVTGFWGGGRNLTAGEILGQVLATVGRLAADGRGLNVVFMGMGEPLLNLEAVHDAVEILSEAIPRRRIAVSTAGVIPGIEALAGWRRRPSLAISLHAPDEERRSRLMPINRRYPLADLLAVLRRYPLERRELLTFEYILIDGFNDAPGDADAVAQRLRGMRAKVNLIPLNPDPVLGAELKVPHPSRVEAFQQRLLDRGVRCTLRRRRGDDVSAACGQLRAFGREPRGFRRSNLSI